MSRRRWALVLIVTVACGAASADAEDTEIRSWNIHPLFSWTAESGFGAGARLEIVGEPPASRRVLVSGYVAQEDLLDLACSLRTRRFLGTSNTMRLSVGHVDDASLRFFGLGGATSVDDETQYRGRRTHLTLAPGREWRPGWETRLRLRVARDEAWDDDGAADLGFDDIEVDHSIMAIALVRDQRDVEWEPVAGFYGLFEVGTTLPVSEVDYRLATLDLRAYRGLDEEDRWVLAMRALWRVVDGPDLPFVLLPTYGGSRARGFSAGRFRGEAAMATTAELRWRPTGEWGLVAFLDAGRVGNGAGFDGSGGFTPAVGGGVRLYPGARGEILRFDAGYGGTEEGVHIFVGFGHTF